MIQLSCKGLTLGYEGRVLVEGLSFDVEAGDYLCIFGENGAGKTTLMKALAGLHAPLAGSIAAMDTGLRGRLGYVPQQTAIQRDFPASVQEIVRSGCLGRAGLRPYYSREEKALAQANIERMGLAALSSRCYRELSGGQQQRVLLARALCAAQKLLLLDEPAAGLDPKVTAELYELLRTLNRRDGVTIIMVSHDLAAALRDASHILHLGAACFFGTTAAYLESEPGRRFANCENGGTV